MIAMAMLMLRVKVERWPEVEPLYKFPGEFVKDWDYDMRNVSYEIYDKYRNGPFPLYGIIAVTFPDGTIIPVRRVFITSIEKRDNRVNFQHILGDWIYVPPEEFRKISNETLGSRSPFLEGRNLMVHEINFEFLKRLETSKFYRGWLDAYKEIMASR